MLDLLKKSLGKTRTENNAVAYNSTGDEVLNLFALGGSVRSRSETDIAALIKSALEENCLNALKTIFYLSDVREGQGERNFFKIALVYLAFKETDITSELIPYIPFFSRWDVLYAFEGTPLEKEAFEFMHKQFLLDMKSKEPSLLGKWLKSINTSSKETKRLGMLTAKHFELSPKEYRKSLSKLRFKINVVETKMSANKWENIDLNTVPSLAFKKYIRAFKEHIPSIVDNYMTKVESGELTMKAKVLYPYQVMQLSLQGDIREAEAQWNALPDYIGDNKEYIIPVIDTSGSMCQGEPQAMLVAKSLGIYVSERLKGVFKDHYITFSDKPVLERIKGVNLQDKYHNFTSLIANTNIEKVFELILSTAVENNVSKGDMPTKILILSDMEFDEATRQPYFYGGNGFPKPSKTLFEKIAETYRQYGYAMPQVMFWNIMARNDQFPMRKDSSGVALVSGFSPVILKSVLAGEFIDPYSVMLKTIDVERYSFLNEIIS